MKKINAKRVADWCIVTSAIETEYGNNIIRCDEIEDRFGFDPFKHEKVWKEILDRIEKCPYVLDHPCSSLIGDADDSDIFADITVSDLFTFPENQDECGRVEFYKQAAKAWESLLPLCEEDNDLSKLVADFASNALEEVEEQNVAV